MAVFFHQLQAMTGGRWLGWSVIAALGCTYAAALYLACVVVMGWARRSVLVALLIASAVLVVLTGVRAELEWGEATSLLLSNAAVPDPSERARLVAACLSRLLGTLIWIPLLLVPVALLVAFALLWRCPRTWQRELAAAGALLSALTAWGICATHWAFIVGFHCDSDCVEERLAQSADARLGGKLRLVGAGVLCWGGWLVVGRKRWAQQAPSASLLLTSSSLLLSGALAAGSMNGRRHDTEHPMARDPSNRMPCVAGAALTRLVPESTSDCEAFDAPALEILPDGARIDGTRVVGSEDLRDVLSARRRLWLEINPGQVFPRTFLVGSASGDSSSSSTNCSGVVFVPSILLEEIASRRRSGALSCWVRSRTRALRRPSRALRRAGRLQRIGSQRRFVADTQTDFSPCLVVGG